MGPRPGERSDQKTVTIDPALSFLLLALKPMGWGPNRARTYVPSETAY